MSDRMAYCRSVVTKPIAKKNKPCWLRSCSVEELPSVRNILAKKVTMPSVVEGVTGTTYAVVGRGTPAIFR